MSQGGAVDYERKFGEAISDFSGRPVGRASGRRSQLGCNFKYRAEGRDAVPCGCSIQTSGSVEGERPMRSASVAAVGELGEDFLLPAAIRERGQTEDDAVSGSASGLGRTVEVACLVEDQGGIRFASVASAHELVQHLLFPASVCVRGQLEDQALSLGPAAESRAIEVSGLVKDQAGSGNVSIAVVEGMKDGLRPSTCTGRQPEGHAIAQTAIVGRRAVEIS